MNPQKRDGLTRRDAKFLEMIDDHGWTVTLVAPRTGEEGACFAYSAGLFLRFGQPEIVMFGLPLDTMHCIINSIGRQMKQGVRFIPERPYAKLLDKYPSQFKIVDITHYREHLGWTSWFYESYEYPVLQCFWPDSEGRFPWDLECREGTRKLQPFLFLPASLATDRVQ